MKITTTILAIMLSVTAFAQVGIQTETPKATLDVVGLPTDASKFDGIIAPRITGVQLRGKTYTSDQTGALVYVTAADSSPAGQTVNVTAIGYYYFNGTQWVSTGILTNIYNSNGSLTGTGTSRTLTLNSKSLNFTGSEQRSSWSTTGTLNQTNTQSSTGQASMTFSGGNNSQLYIQQFYNSNAQILIGGNSTNLTLGTHGTAAAAPVTFITSPGSSALGTERMRITGTGNVGINTTTPTEKLDNNGITRLRTLPVNGGTNAIYTQSNGAASSAQDQTFTATRTVVADANGVLGYVTGLPTSNGNGGVIDLGTGQSAYYTKKVSCTTGRYMSFYFSDVPVIDGIRIDAYIQEGVGNATKYDPRLFNTTANPIKIHYTATASVDTKINAANTTIIAGGFESVNGGGYVYGGLVNSETETVDLVINGKWYRILYFAYIDSDDNTGVNATSYRTIRIAITRLQ